MSTSPFRAPTPYVPLPARLGILLSGRGSNFEALAEACARGSLPAQVVVALSDRPDAQGLRRAEKRGIPAFGLEGAKVEGKEELERRFLELLGRFSVDLLCLAGYMRILSRGFLERYPLRILNIHPSLLPSFPGLNAQEQAIRHGVRVSGATVHFVDAGTDSGPIIDQRAVSIEPGDDAEVLATRILPVEHQLFVGAVGKVLAGGWRIDGRRVLFPDPDKNPTFEGLSQRSSGP